jgi:hypothetical protein
VPPTFPMRIRECGVSMAAIRLSTPTAPLLVVRSPRATDHRAITQGLYVPTCFGVFGANFLGRNYLRQWRIS